MILVNDKFIRNTNHWTMADLDNVDRYMVALADGMGGHKGGEVASSDVLHNLQFFFGDLPTTLSSGNFNEAIFKWLNSINSMMDAKGKADDQYYEMGTTLVTLAYYNKEYYWMNCGDSRIYRLHDGELQQISTDHSLNTMTGEKVHSSILTNCVGGGCKTSYIDINKCTENVKSGDIWMLCSDGLSDMIDDEEIRQLLLNGADANKLCEAAIDAGGFDNVSVCIVKIV
ncbi:MAG: protein phosphatase 2C domain-containing protein [Prevotella sp.]|nr:protein phosphatase 2C domain-containing protein [Prevotella sp.]